MMTASTIQPDDPVYSYLNALGYSERKIACWTMETRLYHDLGRYGDSAIEDMEFLAARFSVDMSNFVFDYYFPPEFEGRNRIEAVLFNSIPFLHRKLRGRREYRPLAMRMIDEAMKVGRWQDIA
jgi:hypothetical protein